MERYFIIVFFLCCGLWIEIYLGIGSLMLLVQCTLKMFQIKIDLPRVVASLLPIPISQMKTNAHSGLGVNFRAFLDKRADTINCVHNLLHYIIYYPPMWHLPNRHHSIRFPNKDTMFFSPNNCSSVVHTARINTDPPIYSQRLDKPNRIWFALEKPTAFCLHCYYLDGSSLLFWGWGGGLPKPPWNLN